MNIGQASSLSGLSPRMIRYCETVGLLPAASRKASGYRTYDEGDVDRLRLVAVAQSVGFTLEEACALVAALDHRPGAPDSAEGTRRWTDTLARKAAAVAELRDRLDGNAPVEPDA